MAATLEDAIRQSIKMYWENTRDFDGLETSKGERKYSKKYFDSIEEEFVSKKDQIKSKEKGEY